MELITSGQVFFTIFDNINIFLRKSQQHISNTNDMINATNVAIVSINGVEPFTEADLAEQLALRGQRAKVKATDILPTPEDDKIVGKSFVALIAEMIVAFTPGNSSWKDRKDIAEAIVCLRLDDELLLSLHPLYHKTDVGRSRPESPLLNEEQAGTNPLSTPASASPLLYKDGKGARAFEDD
ncbi:hypothetical protein B0H14DRAFT_3504280 [Mycena olivaceomarginata]|nr:hypothetical protein B0H14DRAFT_3504280 [Mycena olivaceomarginata]